MEGLLNPAIWLGFLALVAIELVLAVGHVAYAVKISDSLAPQARARAQALGLLSALLIRLVLLASVVWLIQFTTPFLTVGAFGLSIRDAVLISGGLYILLRATLAIYERAEAALTDDRDERLTSRHGMVVLQIALLSIGFTVDMATIAIGLVESLTVMISAAVVASMLSLLLQAHLIRWVSAYPAVTLLCFGFLLILGFSMVIRGFGAVVPEGLLLLVLAFLILVAWFLHGAYPRAAVAQSRLPIRERTVQAVARLLGKNHTLSPVTSLTPLAESDEDRLYEVEERNMVSGVLTLAERSVHSIMTPRTEISWVNLDDDPENIKIQLEEEPHSYFPVCRGSLDDVVGIGRAKRMVADILTHGHIRQKRLRDPIIIHDTITISRLLDTLKRAKGQLVLVADEFGTLQGLVTPIDVFEAIAGEFPDEDETPDIVSDGENRWRMDGATDLHQLEQVLDTTGFVDEDDEYTTLAGYLLNYFGQLPKLGDICEHKRPEAIFTFEVVRIEGRRIALVNVAKHLIAADQEQGE
jgi:CBS domain containing-hemolysin-like protein